MNEEEYFEQLCSNSVDGTLTDSEKQKLEEHLAECPSCAALKEDLEQMHSMLAVDETEPPAGLHDSIMERLRQEETVRVVAPQKPMRRLPAFTMVAAAAVVVLVVLGGGLMPAVQTRPVLTLPQSLHGAHTAYCYVAVGGSSLPDIDGELLAQENGVSWFRLDNSMETIEKTLQTVEQAGCTVTAYDKVDLTIDSHADSWILAVVTG